MPTANPFWLKKGANAKYPIEVGLALMKKVNWKSERKDIRSTKKREEGRKTHHCDPWDPMLTVYGILPALMLAETCLF
jgi:hypothetical protein